MSYVDGFVIAVPKKSLKKYMAMAELGGKVWRDHGALEYRECVADDLKVQGGALSFLKLAKTKPGETVVFSWIVYESKKHRDAVNKKVMKDPRLADMSSKKMPFEMKRMSYGGFKVIVDPFAKK